MFFNEHLRYNTIIYEKNNYDIKKVLHEYTTSKLSQTNAFPAQHYKIFIFS